MAAHPPDRVRQCDPGMLASGPPKHRVSFTPTASASPAPALMVFRGHVPPTYDLVGTHRPAIALSLSSLPFTGHPLNPTQTHREERAQGWCFY